MMTSRRMATPPRTRVIMMLVLVREALDSRSGRSEEDAGIGVTEIVTFGPVVEKVVEEMLATVVVKVLDSVMNMNEVVFTEGRGLGPGGGNPPPPGNPPPVAVVMAEKDIHTKCLSNSKSSPSFLPAETRMAFEIACGKRN
jgi:hypothetical protein